MVITKDTDLRRFNTFGMDVKAACFIEYGSLEELESIGAGVQLKLPALPSGAYDSSKAILTLSGGIAADATAGLVLENAEAFCAAHSCDERITLISCGKDSTAALRNLAASLNATLSVGKASVVGGTSLVFRAPAGLVISIR